MVTIFCVAFNSHCLYNYMKRVKFLEWLKVKEAMFIATKKSDMKGKKDSYNVWGAGSEFNSDKENEKVSQGKDTRKQW